MTFWIVESPVWLVSVGRKEEAMKNLRFIAKMNGQKDFEITAVKDVTFETVNPDEAKKQDDESIVGVAAQDDRNKNRVITAEIEEIDPSSD